MPLPKRPVHSLDDINQKRRDRETINQILDHTFDDSRVQTPAEVAADITPVNKAYPPGDVRRYKGGSLSTSFADQEDWTDAIQAAMDTNNEVFLPNTDLDGSFYGLSRPLYVRTNQAASLTLVGDGRTNVYLHPLSVDISDALGINAMIINTAGDDKFSMRNLRLWSGVSYTGVVIYCVDGAGGGVVEAIFSGSIDDCWFGLDSANAGMLRGGFSNYRITNCVWEFCKTCVILEGAGNGDQVYDNNQCFSCYDEFIRKTDTVVGNLIVCTNLTMYVHHRGQALTLRSVYDFSGSNISMQMDTVSNLGDGGLFNFRDVTHFEVSNFSAVFDSGLGTGSLDEVITLQGCFGRFSNGTIYGADVGVRITGDDNNRLTFDGVDITNSVTAAFRVQTGTPQGLVTLNSCNLSDNTLHGVLFSTEAAFDFYMNHCRIVNAGMGGTAASRNMDIATTGTARLTNCTYGQNNAGAAASRYITGSGSGPGLLEIVKPNIIGTPPTALSDGTQTIFYDGIDSSMPGMPALTPSLGGTATYTTQHGQWSLSDKRVHFSIRLTVNTIGTGSVRDIAGLPFTSNATHYGGAYVNFFSGAATNIIWPTGFIAPGTTTIQMRDTKAAAAGTTNDPIFGDGTDIVMQGSYPVP